MAYGWAEEPGPDDRFGAWRSALAWGGQDHANLIRIAAGALYLRSDSSVRPVSALMPLLGPENPYCPEFISLKSPLYIF